MKRVISRICLVALILELGAGCLNHKLVCITSDPNHASLYINGEQSGKTPFTKVLSFKKQEAYAVTAEKKGHKPATVSVQYVPADQTEYNIVLPPLEKTVTITSVPEGASVEIDGLIVGTTPLQKKLSFVETDKYEVLVKKEGYEDKMISISFEPESRKDYPAGVLKKIETVSVDVVSVEPQKTEKGVKLALVRKPTLAYLEVIERSPNVKSVTRVTNNEDRNYQISAPILSPAEDLLIYSTMVQEENHSSYSNIWKTPIGSFGKTRVTYGKWLDLFPSFEPDGRFIIFSSNRTSTNLTLWRIRTDVGAGITVITNSSAEDYSPSVSTDSNFIAYTSNPPNAEEPQVWLIGRNGDLPTQLREGENPQISPDRKKILFSRKDKITGYNQIWLMNLDGSEETQLMQNVNYDAMHPRWSPDNKWIVFDSNEGLDSKKLQNFDIWIMASDGSKKTQLTTNGSADEYPCWDRTGHFIYFRSNRGGVLNIWRFEPIIP